jgi:hypothetical protein
VPPHNGALVPLRLPILKAAISNQPAYNGGRFLLFVRLRYSLEGGWESRLGTKKLDRIV